MKKFHTRSCRAAFVGMLVFACLTMGYGVDGVSTGEANTTKVGESAKEPALAKEGFALTFAAYAGKEQEEAPLVIVKDGVAKATIVTAEKPTPTVEYAVRELNEHIELCTGVKLPVAKEGNPVTGPAIHVGKTSLTARLGLSPDMLVPDNWVVRRVGQALILSGGDNRFNLAPTGNTLAPFGTLYATYEFLERALGVRWYWPGVLGRVIPKTTGIVLGKVAWQGTPSYETRFVWYGIPKDPDIPADECYKWWFRMRRGSLGGSPIGMHSFGQWNKKYGDKHPEWFALQANGRRLNSTNVGTGCELGHLCWSNPEVLAATIAEKREGFEKSPGIRYSSVMPGDGDGQCQCDKCKARMSAPSAGKTGKSSVVWSFVNQVAAEIRKSNPGRFITCCSYGYYAAIPQDVYLEPNVAVTICDTSFPGRLWDPALKTNYVERLENWSDKASNLYVWDYWLCRYGKGVYGAPSIVPHGIQEWFLLDRGRVKGHAIELPDIDHQGYGIGAWADWVYDSLNIYVGMRLLWNLDQDVDALLTEFYEKFYGPAAGPLVRRFNEELEAAYVNPETKGGPKFRWDWETCWVQTYPPDMVVRVMGYLRAAEEKTRGNEPYHSRVEKTLKSFLPFENASRRMTDACAKAVANTEIILPLCAAPPTIDGKLDDAVWAKAAVANGFMDSFNSVDLRAKTEMRFLRDATTIYVGIRAELPEGTSKRVYPAGSVDNEIWWAESAEIYFIQDVKKHQFLFGPDDVYTDAYSPNREKDPELREYLKWNCQGHKYKSLMADKEWTAELAIPLASLNISAPTKDKPWRANFYRNYYYQDKGAWRWEQGAWRPTFGGFETESRYGVLFFQ